MAARRLAALFLAAGLFRAAQNVVQTTFALLGRADLGMSAGVLGVLGTLAAAAGVTATVGLAARLPPRRSATGAAVGFGVLATGLLAGALSAGAGRAAGPVLLGAGVVLAGLGAGVSLPALATTVGERAGGERDRLLAVYTLVLSASLALGPLAETAILDASRQSLQVPFWAFLPVALAGAALLVYSGRGGGHRAPARPAPAGAAGEADLAGGAAPAAPVAATAPATSATGAVAALAGPAPAEATAAVPPPAPGPEPANRRRSRGGRSWVMLRNPGTRLALTAQLLYAAPFAGITVFGAPLARVSFGVSPAGAQLAFTAFFVASFLARVVLAWRSPVARKARVLRLATVVTLAGLVLLGTGRGAGLLVVGMMLLGVPHGLTFPLSLALIAGATEPAQLARANAGIFATVSAAAVVVPVLLGGVVQALGYQAMVLALLVPVSVMAVLLWVQGEPVTTGPAPR